MLNISELMSMVDWRYTPFIAAILALIVVAVKYLILDRNKAKKEEKKKPKRDEKKVRFMLLKAWIIGSIILFAFVVFLTPSNLDSTLKIGLFVFCVLAMTVYVFVGYYIRVPYLLNPLFGEGDEREKKCGWKAGKTALICVVIALAILWYFPGELGNRAIFLIISSVAGLSFMGSYFYYTKINPPRE